MYAKRTILPISSRSRRRSTPGPIPRCRIRRPCPYVLRTGSLYGSAKRVREQVAELRDVGVQHLLCQTGFGAMNHSQNLASMRRFGEQVMPAFA